MRNTQPIPFPGRVRYSAEKEKENNTFGKRLTELRKSAGYSQKAFSEKLKEVSVSITPSSVSYWESGSTLPNVYQFLAICHVLDIKNPIEQFSTFEKALPKQELNDDGMNRLREYHDILVASGMFSPKPQIAHQIEKVYMPIYADTVSAGYGSLLGEGEYTKKAFPPSSVPEKADFGLRVSGDSMMPLYVDGQIVWVQNTPMINAGQIGVFMVDGEGFIKRYLETKPDKDELDRYTDSEGYVHPKIILESLNENYADREISPDMDFRVVGIVLN